MTIALPTQGVAEASPRYIDMGSVQRSTLGGPDQRLDRMGSRWALDVTTKPLKGEDARIWISRLIRGKREKASIKFSEPGVRYVGLNHTIAAAAAVNAEVISLNANAAVPPFPEGKFISIVTGGVRCLYQVTADAAYAGTFLVGIQPPLRAAVAIGTPYEINPAMIEGYVDGDEFSWTIDNARIYGLRFSIREAQ